MSLRRLLQGTGADIAGTGTGIPGVGVPWKNPGPSGKPLLETGPLVARPLFPRVRSIMTEKVPVVEPPYHARFGAGENLQVERKDVSAEKKARYEELEGFQVERKDVSRAKAARYEEFEGLASKPIETETTGNPMPIRAGKTRRAIRDRTRIESRVAKFRDSARVQSMKQTQFGLEKFTKEQTFYVDHSLYPFLSCRDCIWFLSAESQPDSVSRCAVVSETGGSGIINPEGTSTGFNASPARLKLIERAYGRGEGKRGLLPQAIRRRLMPVGKKLLYPDLPLETPGFFQALTGSVSFNPSSPVVNQIITFDLMLTGGMPPYTSFWMFGDGTPLFTGGVSITHSYKTAGTYPVSVQVADAANTLIVLTTSVPVSPAPAPPPLSGFRLGQNIISRIAALRGRP